MRATFALVVFVIAVTAQATPPSQESLARTHYAAGEQEYARGRWREALREFQAGYDLSPRPEFLINFAQVYRKLGDYDRAIAECERFLATAPTAPLAAQAHRLLAQLREESARAPRAPAGPPRSTATGHGHTATAATADAATTAAAAADADDERAGSDDDRGGASGASPSLGGARRRRQRRRRRRGGGRRRRRRRLRRARQLPAHAGRHGGLPVKRLLLAVALLAGCTQSGTGVELLIETGGITLDELDISAQYGGRTIKKVVGVAAGTTLDLLAQLPDESTMVTFTVDALASGQPVAHGASMQIAVTAHHIVTTTITLLAGGGDGFAPSDLAGADLVANVGWTHQQGALPPGAGAINGIWGSSGSDVYAAATATGGVNLYRSIDHGAHWNGQLAGAAVNLNGVGGTSSSDVYLVGDNATILHGGGTSWTPGSPPISSTIRLNAVWALAPGDVYVVGSSNTVLHSSGASWIDQTAITGTELRGVWGVTGKIWAVGSGGVILKSDGVSWSNDVSNTGAELRAIWGSSASDVWAVGDGTVMHYDGVMWSAALDGVPAGESLHGVGGRIGGPLFAVGAGWLIVRRDASAWAVEPTGLPVDDPAGDVLGAVFVPSAAEAFAGGAGLTLLHRP
jgi:hypothetical protein